MAFARLQPSRQVPQRGRRELVEPPRDRRWGLLLVPVELEVLELGALAQPRAGDEAHELAVAARVGPRAKVGEVQGDEIVGAALVVLIPVFLDFSRASPWSGRTRTRVMGHAGARTRDARVDGPLAGDGGDGDDDDGGEREGGDDTRAGGGEREESGRSLASDAADSGSADVSGTRSGSVFGIPVARSFPKRCSLHHEEGRRRGSEADARRREAAEITH